MAKDQRGFTLVELVFVVTTIALLAWVALPRNYVPDTRMGAAARKIQHDIRYAQELAMTRGERHQIRFFSSTNPSPTNRYDIVTATGGPVKNPLTGDGSYVVELGSGTFSGVQLDTTTTLGFSSLGRPLDSLGNPLVADMAISLNGGGKIITVTTETGRVVF